MATYKCGHTEEIQLYGKHDERDRKLNQMAEALCPHCKREHNEKLTGLILEGSDKQANWAYDIMSRVNQIFDAVKAQIKPEFAELLEQVRNDYNSHTSAKWWIEEADHTDNRSIALAMKERMSSL